MSQPPAMNVAYDPAHTEIMGALRIDRRSWSSGLSHLTAGFAEWLDETPTEPWALPYEEAVLVLEGELRITYGDEVVIGRPGDLVTVEQGTETVASATAGTKLFFASYPRNWKELVGE